MTDLSKLGEELRRELGQPPPGWNERQRLRLRGVDLEKRTPSRLPFLLAALGLFTLTVAGAAYFRKPAHEPLAGGSAPSSATERSASGPEEERDTRDAWLGGVGSQRSYPIPGGGSISLDEDARGRLDESRAEGTRFDLHEGRASFDVKLREKSPFSVVAGEYRIVVVGTKFSVAYQAPDVLDVIVTEGVVEVHLPSRVESLQVHAGESLAASSAGFSLKKGSASPFSASELPAPPPPTTALDWRKLYHEGKYEAACRAARAEQPTKLRSTLDVTGLVDLAGALGLCGETDAALVTLQTARKRFPGTPEANDALFLIGRIHAKRGSSLEATSHFEGYLQGGSGGRFAAEALGRLIELHRAAGHHDEAKKFAARYLKIAPQGAYHRLAQSLLNAH